MNSIQTDRPRRRGVNPVRVKTAPGDHMLFTIHALDKPGARPARLAAYDAHRAYLNETDGKTVKIVIGGPLVEDDGETAKGSFFLVDVPDRAAAESFSKGDPFHKAGVWESVRIVAFLKRRG
jgi:uncharacterized protein